MTSIFTSEQVIKYAQRRLFGSNVTADDVKHIRLYNGMLPGQLEQELEFEHRKYERVLQQNPKEPIYHTAQTLHIPQYSGFGRRRRYEAMIRRYIDASGRSMDFTSLDLDNNERKTNVQYDNFAYDFTMGLFVPEEKYHPLFAIRNARDVHTIILGRVDAVTRQGETKAMGNSPYLSARLISFGSTTALAVGEVYADQAGILLDKILWEYEAMARHQGTQKKLTFICLAA